MQSPVGISSLLTLSQLKCCSQMYPLHTTRSMKYSFSDYWPIIMIIQTTDKKAITSHKLFGFWVEICQKARSETKYKFIGKWSGSPQRKHKNIYVFLMVYGSSYVMDTSAHPDSADTNGNSMKKSGFHSCSESFILLILTYLETFSDIAKLNMLWVFARLGPKNLNHAFRSRQNLK